MKAFSKLVKSSGGKFVGLDIGSSLVKAVVLSQRGRKFELLDFALERLSGTKGTFNPSSAARRIVSSLGVSGEDIATAVSGHQVVMRHIEVPKMTEEELRASIKYETDIHFPFKLEDAIVDFSVLEKAAEVDKSKMKVFMVAARKEMIEHHLKMLGAANITPAGISVDTVALINACEGAIDTAGRFITLVNIGARKTIIIIVGEGTFSFSREAEIGCTKLFSAISKGHSVSNEEAVSIIQEKVTDVDAYLSSFITEIVREVKSSIDYFEERSGVKVKAVYIDGGGSMIDGIDNRLSEELGLEVNKENVLTGAIGALEPTKRKEFEKVYPLFTISYGLASGISAAS